MKPFIEDTDDKTKRVQVELLRKAGLTRRVSLALSLSDTVIHLARKAIAEARPELTPREQALFFVEVHYGDALATKVRQYLIRKDHGF